MAVSGLLLKVGVPLVLVAGGAVAAVAVPDRSEATAAQLWIDSPADASRIAPGPVTVVAHAADELSLDSMTLVVDGKDVDTRNDLRTYDRLAAVQFTWNAVDGEHFLVVRGGGQESDPVAVVVGAAGALGTPEPSRGPSAKPSATASATPSATPSANPTTPATPTSGPSPTKAPPTKAPPADPQVLSVSVSPNAVNGAACTGTVTVTAKVKNATGGSAQVIGEGVGSPVNDNIGGSVSGGTFTATFKQRDFTGNNLGGPFRVEVTVTNANGFDVGAASFTIACSKD